MRRKGFTLVEIMIVVAILGLLAAIAIPNFVKARFRAGLYDDMHITSPTEADGKYMDALWDESKGDIKKARELVNLGWRPANSTSTQNESKFHYVTLDKPLPGIASTLHIEDKIAIPAGFNEADVVLFCKEKGYDIHDFSKSEVLQNRYKTWLDKNKYKEIGR